ncbi:MAG: DUF2934 domain-containing protein [Gammaproteobacteria bacterium]|nr:DUF2934 domain-containing protein [Gammaproteobacteria bacterium]
METSPKNATRRKTVDLQTVQKTNGSTPPSYEDIAREAYLRAEKRGFMPGGEMQDWLEAERALSQQQATRQ